MTFPFYHPSIKKINADRFVYQIGMVFILFYVLTRLTIPSVSKVLEIGIVLLGVFLILTSRCASQCKCFFYLFALSLVVQIIPWISSFFIVMPAVDGFPSLDRLAKLFLFIPMAFILSRNNKSTYYLWSCALIGFLCATLMQKDDWVLGLSGERVDFGIRNAQHTALYFGMSLLGLIFFCGRIFHYFKNKAVVVFLLMVWLAFSIFGIYITQTRAIFLSLLITAAIVGFWYILFANSKFSKKNIFTVSILVMIPFFMIAKNIMVSRTESEMQVVKSIYHGDIKNIEYSSIGIRVNTWLEAINKIEERPILGWGQSARSWVIQQSRVLPEWVKKDFGHLHNYPLEIQLSYGLFGTVWLLLLWLTLAGYCYRLWQRNEMPKDMFYFSISFLTYFFIVNLFESYLSFWTGVYLFNIVCAGLVSNSLRCKTIYD